MSTQLFRFTFPELPTPPGGVKASNVISVLSASKGGAYIVASTIYRRTYKLDPTTTVLAGKVEVVRPNLGGSNAR